MNLLFDTSVWIDDLRYGALRFVLPRVRGKYFLWVDSISVVELLAGCSTRQRRRVVERLLSPFERAGRVVTPNHRDFHRAGDALSKLRGSGVTLKNPGAALLDAVQAADAARIGALLVTANTSDFTKLARFIPVTIKSFDDFRKIL
ncbi:MAG TPA: PIN domain-containing protein [Planctomycetota bacterium]|nr:PIN domain-containing protein [Planctomycetota bacterium]